ncbi:MAG: hypothetical protein V3U30_02925 [Thermoplasmata archaeon]
MSDARERLKDEAVRDAVQRLASGEWSLTPSQLAIVAKMKAASPDEGDHLLAILKNVKADLLRALEAGPSAAIRKHIDEALSRIAGVEVGAKSSTPRAATREEFEKLRSEVASVARIAAAIEKMGRGIRPEEAARRILEKIRASAGTRVPFGAVSSPGTPPQAKPADNPRLQELTRTLMEKVRQAADRKRSGGRR